MNSLKASSLPKSQEYDLNHVHSAHNPRSSTMVTHQIPGDAAMTGKRTRDFDENDVHPGNAKPAEGESRKKRSRGRPRLDTKDETAADRRRTQIRLAQRAYRHRKDTTITVLEQRVKELQQANQDIAKGFHDFYDLLLSERVLEAAPHAIQRLSAIAQNITTVAERARSSSGEVSGSDEGDEYTISHSLSHHGPRPMQSAPHPAGDVTQNTEFRSNTQQTDMIGTCGGSPGMPVNIMATSSGPPSGPLIHAPTSLNYEIVTAPTPDNASFPFYSSMEPTSVDHFDGLMATGHTPYASIASPLSYASHELTFGRRLQRQSMENGLRLIMMPNPPPDRFAAVFGFCLFFESKEAIIKRLQVALSRSQQEDLGNWKVPFINLGGAGTFFPMQQSIEGTDSMQNSMPVGNQGTKSYGKPSEMTGQSMGPFGPKVEATRDERMDRKMRMLWPGFEGEFFDADEVEIYLRQLGIFIPSRAEYVEADIDISELDRDESSSRNSSLSAPTSAPSGKPSVLANSDSGYGSSSHGGSWSAGSDSPVPGTTDATSASDSINMSQPTMIRLEVRQHGARPLGEFAPGMGNYLLPTDPNRIWSPPTVWPVKSKIALNVSLLISELSNSSVCLGRSPGIRRKDVNSAVKVAAGLATSSA